MNNAMLFVDLLPVVFSYLRNSKFLEVEALWVMEDVKVHPHVWNIRVVQSYGTRTLPHVSCKSKCQRAFCEVCNGVL